MSPTSWIPNGIATDCLWYDEFQGNQACARYGCSLGVDEDSPCILCKEYKLFERGYYERILIRKAILNREVFVEDKNGQLKIDGI